MSEEFKSCLNHDHVHNSLESTGDACKGRMVCTTQKLQGALWTWGLLVPRASGWGLQIKYRVHYPETYGIVEVCGLLPHLLSEACPGRMGYTAHNPKWYLMSMWPAAPRSLYMRTPQEEWAALHRILGGIWLAYSLQIPESIDYGCKGRINCTTPNPKSSR